MTLPDSNPRNQSGVIDEALEELLYYGENPGSKSLVAQARKEHLALLADNAMLRRCISEHHAAGVLDEVLIGEDCPVCERFNA